MTPNLYLFDKNYQQPFTQQFHLQFEKEVFANTVFSAEYQMFRGSDLTRTRNANLSAPVPTTYPVFDATGTATGETLTVQRFPATRPIPQFQRISLFESTAKSFYQGLSLQLNRRFSNRFQFNTSYTLSKAKDSKPDQTSVVPGADDSKIAQNQFDLSGEYGISDLDVRHRFIFSPLYETGRFHSDNSVIRALLSDYLITGILSAQSGFTYSAAISNDPNNDGNTANDRAPGTARNQFTSPGFYQIDLRVGRMIRLGERARLSLFAEGFNIFNSSNVQSVNRNLYTFATTGGGRLTRTTNFGTPSIFVSGSPSFTFNSSYNREFQLGMRLDF